MLWVSVAARTRTAGAAERAQDVGHTPALLTGCVERWMPTTRHAYADGIRLHILSAFGGRSVDVLIEKDVRNGFDDLSAAGARSANRKLAVLSSMMKCAEARKPQAMQGTVAAQDGIRGAHYLTDGEFAAHGHLLGHRRATKTDRHMPLDDTTLSQAAERVSFTIVRKLHRIAIQTVKACRS